MFVNSAPRVTREVFGRLPGGRTVDAITLRNRAGIQVRVTTYGARILSLLTPDRQGRFDDVVLGFDGLEPYLGRAAFFGCMIGRYANRIALGTFTLDGVTHRLETNDGPNHLHGGSHGWHTVNWAAAPFEDGGSAGVAFDYISADGDGGYPGTVDARLTYALNDRDELVLDYAASTDRPTIVNLTHHSFFNLGGPRRPDILGHELTIDAASYIPVTAALIPTGEVAPVAGTPFDFRELTPVGARIDDPDEQLAHGRGFDHNFVLNRTRAGLAHAATLRDPSSGRTLDVATTEPGLQFYSGNFLYGPIGDRSGRAYGSRAGLCLEPQHYPDSPNRPHFPSTVLRPGERYTSRTVFTFGVDR